MSVEEQFCAHWAAAWSGLGKSPPHAGPLLARYGESHRHYHNAAHIVDCLELLDHFQLATGEQVPCDSLLALFYHDVIYEPRAADNEEQSAAFACQHLGAYLTSEHIETISRRILVTDHRRPLTTADEQLIVDVDLSILGRDTTAFTAYDRGIRAEYAHVPDNAYRLGRANVFQHFLSRPRLYHTQWFFERYEATARDNLARTITQLSM